MLECFIVCAGLVIDQLTKLWAAQNLGGEVLSFIPGILNFRYVENTGAAFGMFSNGTLLLTILSAVMSVVLVVILVKYRRQMGRFMKVALALVLAGALGNLIDRLALGYVVDFIEFDFVHFAVFNIADTCVTIGAIMMAVYLLFLHERWKGKKGAVLENGGEQDPGTVGEDASPAGQEGSASGAGQAKSGSQSPQAGKTAEEIGAQAAEAGQPAGQSE